MASLLINVLAIKSTYSQQNCQNVQTSIQIIDETGGRWISATSLYDSPFKNYVTTISQHVRAKIDGMAQCHGDLKSSPEVKLFFVYRRDTRYLDSPWVKLTFSRSPRLVVRAVFLWNEQQFLLDQSLMSGIRASPTNPLVPIDQAIFEQFVENYTDSVLAVRSPEAKSAGQASISKRLPPEIFWLFRNARQSSLSAFQVEVTSALNSILTQAAIGYTDLTKALVDQFFTSAQTEIRYESVLDLKDIFTLDRYRVNRLH
ncbi:MAG: hypothetical protein EAZ90_24430 [Oscillatoriales cyanobacterium]|nr:MAG: hypothetical protein EAZ90_24430 [Oscillatoriales cyanobacterium]